MENTEEKFPKGHVTTSIALDVHRIAKDHGIAWNDALKFGILFLRADQEGGLEFDYPSSTMQDKLQRCSKLLNAKCQECESLRDQMPNQDVEKDLKDAGIE